MRTITFFAVCLLALGVIGMCSAKKVAKTPHEQFCSRAELEVAAVKKYLEPLENLREAHTNGHLMEALNPQYVNNNGKH